MPPTSNLERISETKVTLEVTVEADQVQREWDRMFQNHASKVRIPGFRTGKAPRKIVERYVPRDAVGKEVLDKLVPDTYQEVVKENQLRPITFPSFEIKQFQEGLPFIYKATLEVRPEIPVEQYKGLQVSVPKEEVTDQQESDALEQLRERAGKWISVEGRSVQEGDLAVLDYKGTVNGETFPGGEGEGLQLEIVPDKSVFPELTQALIGMLPNEKKDIRAVLPAPFGPDWAGKEADFVATLKELKEKSLPQLDDEFARDLGGFETLEALKAEVRRRLEAALREKEHSHVAVKLLEQLSQSLAFPLPESLVQTRKNQIEKDLNSFLASRGIRADTYKDDAARLEAFKEDIQKEAEKKVKEDLLLDEIAKREGLSVANEDINAELVRISQATGQSPARLVQFFESQGTFPYLVDSLLKKKALDFLVNHAEINHEEGVSAT
ncbi:MAG: trigger factor [Armatimonadetes bacterium]|nr:trigger factor [Armatimonadota bacterium]